MQEGCRRVTCTLTEQCGEALGPFESVRRQLWPEWRRNGRSHAAHAAPTHRKETEVAA